MKFFIVDAFTENVFGGNPAGVVLLDSGSGFPGDEVMIKTAAELRYSETAFVKQEPDGELRLRYFTPTAEVDFCGHATIAAFTVLLKSGVIENNYSYGIDTLSGKLTIDVTDDFIMMGMPASKIIKRMDAPEEIAELYKAMGIGWEPVTVADEGDSAVELAPVLISTGFPDIFLPVKDRRALAEISPDFKALSALTERRGAGGVHAFTLDAPETGITACTRNFAPLYGIDEEAATGTASGGLTYYLYAHGLALPGQDCCFLQGEAMERPSKIFTTIKDAGKAVEIKVGGKGAILAEGEIHLI